MPTYLILSKIHLDRSDVFLDGGFDQKTSISDEVLIVNLESSLVIWEHEILRTEWNGMESKTETGKNKEQKLVKKIERKRVAKVYNLERRLVRNLDVDIFQKLTEELVDRYQQTP